jgi:hypothetical protein
VSIVTVTHQRRTDVELEAMTIAPVPTPAVLWRHSRSPPSVERHSAVSAVRTGIHVELIEGRVFAVAIDDANSGVVHQPLGVTVTR